MGTDVLFRFDYGKTNWASIMCCTSFCILGFSILLLSCDFHCINFKRTFQILLAGQFEGWKYLYWYKLRLFTMPWVPD